MQGVALCYTQHVNRKYQRTGRLWESRYHSCIIDQESYLWAVARYIEQNPVRSQIVDHPAEYTYSSARAHLHLTPDPVLGEDLYEEEKQLEYMEFINFSSPEGQVIEIRKSLRTGRPLGTHSFISDMEGKLSKKLTALPVGRPKKVNNP